MLIDNIGDTQYSNDRFYFEPKARLPAILPDAASERVASRPEKQSQVDDNCCSD
jgi:hypothetical protein